MKILVHDYSGHPFQAQLSRELARLGHEVTHATCPSFKTGKGNLVKGPDDPETLVFTEVRTREEIAKYSFGKRLLQEMEYGRRCAALVRDLKPDVVIDSNVPLDALSQVVSACRKLDIPHVFWLQDLYGDAIRRILGQRLGLAGRLVGHRYVALERRLLRGSAAVVCICEEFRGILVNLGLDGNHVHTIENWAPLNEVPSRPRDNSWAIDHDLVGRRVALYSGTLGLKHNPGALWALARQLHGTGDRLVVVSEGLGADWLRDQLQQEPCDSLVLLPYQSWEQVPEVLASADVLLALLEDDAGQFSVPSKVLTYLCIGRPIAAVMPGDNLAARILADQGAGLTIENGNAELFPHAVKDLLEDAPRRAAMGAAARSYAERTFDINTIASRFEAVLEGVI